MILTRDYKPVWASLDQPQEFRKSGEYVYHGWMDISYEFTVGPLTYEVGVSGKEGNWEVEFEVAGVNGTEEELIEFFSKVFKKKVEPSEIPRMKSYIMNNRMADLGVGNAAAVMSTVIAIVRDVLSRHQIDCLSFVATTDKKGHLYRRLIRTYLKGWEVKHDDGSEFEICKVYR